jgi:hypothetical protein
MSVGRNDPCPCGSGRKYKKCCLARGEAARPEGFYRDGERTSALRRLVDFARSDEFSTDFQLAEILFWGGRLEGLPEREREAVLRAEQSQAAFTAFFLFDLDVENGRSPCDFLLERRGAHLLDGERAYLERAGRSHLRPYEVVEVRPEEGLRLRDLWEEGREIRVRERLATRQLVRWDVLAARLVEAAPGIHEIDGGVYHYPRERKDELLAMLREAWVPFSARLPGAGAPAFFKRHAMLFQHFQMDLLRRPKPTLVTAEGDPVELGTGVFAVRDEAALRRALAEHPAFAVEDGDVFIWREPGGRILGTLRLVAPDLVAEVQSRARMARLRKLLATQAGDALRFRSARYQDPWEAMEASEGSPSTAAEAEGALPPEEAERLRREFLADHYQRWLDESIPALGGRTPRQAVRTTAGRARVEELVRTIEVGEARHAGPGARPYDFGWLRRELGLPVG